MAKTTYNSDWSYTITYADWSSKTMDSYGNVIPDNSWTSTPTTDTVTTPTPTPTQDNGTTYTPTTQTNQNQWTNLWDWNYWEDTDRRQQEIVNNLNEAYTTNPNQFSDWWTFAQNFNYDYSWRSDKERETMRNWYQQNMGNQMDYNNVNNTDYFLAQLMSWQTLWWAWAAATAAQNRYKNLQALSAMTPDQIVSAVQSGAINWVWQEMQDLKNYSPALYAQVQTAIQNQTTVWDINSMWMWIYDWLTKTSTNSNYTKYNFTDEYKKNASVIKQYNESLYKKIEWLGWDTAAYVAIVASMLQNPLIQANKDEIENIEWEINKIQENIWTIWDTVREKLWSEAPEDLVSAYISNQTKQLQNQLRTAQNSLLVAQWKLNNQLSEVETMIDAINNWVDIQQYNDKMAWTWTTTTTTPSWWTWTSTYTPTSKPTDTYNYQDDSTARLQEIQKNLENFYKTNPELFKDRDTFNNYFKYNQRSAKQKALLDNFWMKKKWMIGWFWTWSKLSGSWATQEQEDNLISALKRDLMAWIVNFSSTSMKKKYGNYWVVSRAEKTTDDALQEIWKISTWDELQSIKSHLSNQNDIDKLTQWFWSVSSHKQALVNNVKKIWNWDTKAERQQISDYLTQFWLDESAWRTTLTNAWIKEKYINQIIAL